MKSKKKTLKIKTISKKKSQNLVVPILLGSLAIVGIFGYGIYRLIPKATPIGINQVSQVLVDVDNWNLNGSVTLSFLPQPTLSKNTPFQLPIKINTNGSKVAIVSLVVAYNPFKLEALSVSPAASEFSLLKETIVAPVIDKDAGTITFTYAAPTNSGGISSGDAQIAKINFKPIGVGSSDVLITRQSKVGVVGKTTNELKPVTPITLNVE